MDSIQNRNELGRQMLMKYPRRIGACFLAGGLGLLYVCVMDPIASARNGAHFVQISLQGIFVGAILALLGIFCLIGGESSAKILSPGQGQSKIPLYIALTAGSVLALIICWTLNVFLREWGFL